MYRQGYSGKVLSTLISFLLLLCVVLINQLLIYTAVELEGSIPRLINLYSRYSLDRFFYITIFSDIINALQWKSLYIWGIVCMVLMVQWIARNIPSWIVFIFTLVVYQFVLQRFNIFSVNTIFNNLTLFVAVGNYIMVVLGLIFIYFDFRIYTLEQYKEKLFNWNRWILCRIAVVFWGLLLIVYSNYQYIHYYLSTTLLVSVLAQLVCIGVLLFIDVLLDRRQSLYTIGNSLFVYVPPQLFLVSMMVIPSFCGVATLYSIFHSSEMSTGKLIIIAGLLLIIGVLYVLYITRMIIVRVEYSTSWYLRILEICFFLILGVCVSVNSIFPYISIILFIILSIYNIGIIYIHKYRNTH